MTKDIEIIFIDIDGTLTNNKGIITDYTKTVIKTLTKKGIYVIMCSGRANNDLIENAIRILLDYLNINKNFSMCIGDGINDFSMFNVCKYKVAMVNGNKKLKEKADFVTKFNNDEDGVAKFIKNFYKEFMPLL